MEVSWDSLHAEIAACEKCDLCRHIHNKVPGQGDGNADLMFIGEGPGADEDLQGLAFVGAAGQLLTKMIAAIGMNVGSAQNITEKGRRASTMITLFWMTVRSFMS